MSATFSQFQKSSALACVAGCGKCCQNPEVEASVLEMLPFAVKVFEEGRLEEWLTLLKARPAGSCVLFVSTGDGGKGYCSSYRERPAVCRMFGVAGYYNKHHEVVLSVCKHIKEAHQLSEKEIRPHTEDVPIIAEWMTRLMSLHPELVSQKIPINQAIYGALEKVALYAQYNLQK